MATESIQGPDLSRLIYHRPPQQVVAPPIPTGYSPSYWLRSGLPKPGPV